MIAAIKNFQNGHHWKSLHIFHASHIVFSSEATGAYHHNSGLHVNICMTCCVLMARWITNHSKCEDPISIPSPWSGKTGNGARNYRHILPTCLVICYSCASGVGGTYSPENIIAYVLQNKFDLIWTYCSRNICKSGICIGYKYIYTASHQYTNFHANVHSHVETFIFVLLLLTCSLKNVFILYLYYIHPMYYICIWKNKDIWICRPNNSTSF